MRKWEQFNLNLTYELYASCPNYTKYGYPCQTNTVFEINMWITISKVT